MNLKCYDLGCPLADRCALHVDGEPGPGEECVSSLRPYDVLARDGCLRFIEKQIKGMNMDGIEIINESELLCSFCGRMQSEVDHLISGPAVYICNMCLQLCNEIVADRKLEKGESDE